MNYLTPEEIRLKRRMDFLKRKKKEELVVAREASPIVSIGGKPELTFTNLLKR